MCGMGTAFGIHTMFGLLKACCSRMCIDPMLRARPGMLLYSTVDLSCKVLLYSIRMNKVGCR